jgi:hypothetical protein
MTITGERDTVMTKTPEDSVRLVSCKLFPGGCEGVEPVFSARIPYV